MTVGLGKTRRGHDFACVQLRAMLIAGTVQRCEDVFGKFPRFRQRRLGKSIGKIRIDPVLMRQIDPHLMNHAENDVGNGRAIGH